MRERPVLRAGGTRTSHPSNEDGDVRQLQSEAIDLDAALCCAGPPTDSTYLPRPPTAFQQYLDDHELARPRRWRQGK